MPTRSVTGDDFDTRKLIAFVAAAGAGYTLYRAVKGQKVPPLAIASADLTLVISFQKELNPSRRPVWDGPVV